MKKIIFTLFVFCMILVSCDVTNLSDLNENEKDPADVPAEPLFSNAQVTLGSFIHNTNVNLNIFKLITQWWTTTLYTAEPRYEIDSRTIPSNVWTQLYRDVLLDLKTSGAKVRENAALSPGERANKLASIEVLETLAYYQLLTIFGNIPYTEALNPEIVSPAYDDAEMVYMAIMDSLNTAISQFDPSAAGFGDADIYYGASSAPIENWIRFANSLKMRMAITIADVNPEVAEQAIVEAADSAISSNAQNAMIPFTASPPTTNPVWEALIQSGRDDYIPAAPFVERMNALNDPRRPVFFTQIDSSVAYVGGVYGAVNDYSAFSHFSDVITEPSRPGMILGYSEVEFILAEALARGYAVPGTVEGHYNAAIRADMEYWGVPDAEITAYLAQDSVAYDPGGDFRQQIGLQKWFALHLQGLQGWIEYRRLDTPALEAPPNAAVNIVPNRYTYPIDEQNFNNANYREAVEMLGGPDDLTTQLFWDVNEGG